MSAARPEENAAAEALPDDEGPSSEDMVVSPPSAPTETSAAREDEEEGDDTLLEDAPDDLARLTAKPPPPRPVPRASGLTRRKERSERKRIAAARVVDGAPGADGSSEAESASDALAGASASAKSTPANGAPAKSTPPKSASASEAASAAPGPAAPNGSVKASQAAASQSAASQSAASRAGAAQATAAKAAGAPKATDDVDTVEDVRRRARVRKAERAKAAASKGEAKKTPGPWEDDTVLESRAELGPLPSSRRGPEDVERIGRYRVLKHIESGGFANVYLGRLVGLAGFGRFVALKRIHDHLAQQHEFVEMFLDEARLASAIDHPNVCAPIDFGRTEDGAYYLAMDYLLGEPLTSIRRAVGRAREEVGPEDMAFAVRVVADAAHGLHAAHEAHDVRGRPLEVVHRDVAPGNLFVLYSGHVKVVDFGIAHAARKLHTTKNGIFKGHLAFAAPEQVRAEPVDRRTDVWSLGVILWEMLARRRLFRQSHELALINAILVDPVPRLDELAPWVPEPLVELVHRCLERDREKRPETALELALELERQLGALGEPMGVHEVGSYVCALLPDRAHQKHRELWALAGDLQAEASSEQALPQMMEALRPLAGYKFALSLDYETSRWDLH